MKLSVAFYSIHIRLSIPAIRSIDYFLRSRRLHQQIALSSILAGPYMKRGTPAPGLASAVLHTTSGTIASQAEESVHKFPELCVRIHTCGELYEKWNKERRYWSVPKGDISFDIKYVDTAANDPSQESPVVVALHGAAGSLHLFEHLTSYLDAKGVRVIVPTLPDHSAHELKVFRHTSEENCQLVKDFLRKLRIARVDMLICHSGAVYPGLLLCLQNQSPGIRSLTMLNPGGFLCPRAMNPYPLLWFIVRVMEFPLGYTIGYIFFRVFLMFQKELKSDQIMKHILSAVTIVHSNFLKSKFHFEELLHRDLPVLLAFSENDKLITKKELYDIASRLVDSSEINRCDTYGRLKTGEGKNLMRKVIAFENGGHYVMKKYPKIVSEELTRFLFESVLKKDV